MKLIHFGDIFNVRIYKLELLNIDTFSFTTKQNFFSTDTPRLIKIKSPKSVFQG